MNIGARTAAWSGGKKIPYPVVDYLIADSRESWFDTGIVPSHTFCGKAKAYVLSGGLGGIFGCGWGNNAKYGHFNFPYSYHQLPSLRVGIGTVTFLIGSNPLLFDIEFTVDGNALRVEVNGEEYLGTTSFSFNDDMFSIGIGRSRYSVGENKGIAGTQYYAVYLNNGEDEVDLVPINYKGKGAYFDRKSWSVLEPSDGTFSIGFDE